ncbi:MAG TPA: SdrD B-like domain-containing protein [Burkholderiaceae bacterium]|nr:SdrD B-like domain-containing protein [Burkholderiaceae bacterium]
MAAAISGLPTALRPGQQINGVTLSCTNLSTTTSATAASCALGTVTGATASTPVCTPTPGGNVAAGAAIQCVFNLTVNGQQGGADEPTTAVVINGSTGASNDSNSANNAATARADLLDAVDDSDSKPGGSSGQTSNLASNDQSLTGASFAFVAGGSCANASVGSTGVASYDVPATGSCTVKYKLCAASPNAGTCDTATLTVTAQAADMRAAVTGMPAVVSPGQAIDNVTLTCRNGVGGAAAIAPTCVPSVDVGSLSGLTCTPASAATLAAGGEIVCRMRYTAPGSPGGGREVQTAVMLTGRTSALNDGDPSNNGASVQARIIDAVDDGRVTVPMITGGSVALWTNDRLGGGAVSASAVTTALTADGGMLGVSLDAQGRVVVPAGVARGSYAMAYRLCSVETPAACDSATLTIQVLGEPDLSVVKTHSPAVFLEGGRGTYRIVVSNHGDAASSGSVSVVDRLPAGLTVAAVPTGSGWDCSATVVGSALATCSRSDALGGATGGTATAAPEITLTVDVAKDACAAPDANGLCSGALVNRVSVDGGNEPSDPEHRRNNTATDPTDVQKAGAVSGRVWRDIDHDHVFRAASGDRPLEGMVVEVLDGAGAVIATSRTDDTGAYSVGGLVPGSGYSVRFRDPVTGAYYGRPISADPAGGNGSNADPTTGLVAGAVIQNVTIPSGASRINQSLPLDPAGVVYAADTRLPLAGAKVELLTAAGSLVPANCMVGGVNSVTTSVGGAAVDGGYSLWLANPAPAGCPGATEYQLRITPPAGYAVSSAIAAQNSALAIPAGCVSGTAAGVCAVQAQNGPPTGSQPTTWYLRMPLDPSAGPDVVNNHIPLDSAVKPALFVTKIGDRSRVELGDSLRYTITVKRSDAGVGVLNAVEVFDTLPAGLRYIDGTAQIDGLAVADPGGKPGPVLRFSLGTMGPGALKVLTYRVRVGVGAQQGSGINRAQATSLRDGQCSGAAGEVCSNEARHRVEVSGGVFANEACVVGKVYSDCNHNQMQDAEEPGIPGVRLYLQDGTSFVTDVEGKYSHCGLPPRTHVLVVDQTTLPRGSRLVTSSNRNAGDAGSLFLDLRNGELHRADFIEGSCSPTVTEQVKARRSRGDTGALDTEKARGRVLKFDGKPVTAPQQATDSADQRGNAGGRGEPGAVKPRRDGGQPPDAQADRAGADTLETIHIPVSAMPTSSGATQPPARQP